MEQLCPYLEGGATGHHGRHGLDDPYLTDQDQPYGTYQVSFTITIVADIGTNDRMTDQLDTLIKSVVTAVPVANVGRPIPFIYNTAKYLAAIATFKNTLTIPEA